jgi:hypothetical protein
MDTNKFVKSKTLKWLILGCAELALIAIVFRTGMIVGFSKANYNFRWGAEYHNMFGGPRDGWFGARGGRGGMMGGAFELNSPIGQFGKDGFSPGHNVFGTIINISSSTIIVKGSDNVEKSLLISTGTTIRRGRSDIKISDLKENEKIVALGSPSSTGQIETKFIRVFQP